MIGRMMRPLRWLRFLRSRRRMVWHRPLVWVWGANTRERAYGLRHWGLWLTEPWP
jgi:hypothetical protein